MESRHARGILREGLETDCGVGAPPEKSVRRGHKEHANSFALTDEEATEYRSLVRRTVDLSPK